MLPPRASGDSGRWQTVGVEINLVVTKLTDFAIIQIPQLTTTHTGTI